MVLAPKKNVVKLSNNFFLFPELITLQFSTWLPVKEMACSQNNWCCKIISQNFVILIISYGFEVLEG